MAKKIDLIGSEIFQPTMWYRSKKTGKPVFAMKKIDYEDSLYYIFRVHKENMEEGDREAWERVWALLCEMARFLGIPLYDALEIDERLNEAIKEPKPWEGQRDFKIELYDHASGELHIVTKGVTLLYREVVGERDARSLSDQSKPSK